MTTLEPVQEPPKLSPATEVASPYDPEMKAAGQLTSPTWELELFISGAFVFATFQLPGWIEQLFTSLDPHTTEAMSSVLFMGALYGKAIAFTLIGMFMVHLIARAYWIALLGLQSVFPRGIDWQQMKIGPIAKDVFKSYAPDTARVIATLDNFCSVVFSVGLLIVFIFLFTTALVALAGGIAYGFALAFSHGQNTRLYFYGIMALFVAVPVGASVIDRARGERMAPGSRQYRLVHRLMRFSFAINMMRVTGPMVWTLMTNIGRARSMVFMYVAIIGLILVSAADRLAQSDRLSVNAYDFFGASRVHSVIYRFYEDQRQPGKSYPRVPSIQSDIIRDPYVKLFIPYYPRRDNAAIARACPGIKPLQARGIQIGGDAYLADSLVTPVLACIAKLHAVTLDGVPRPEVEFSFYEQPVTGVKGVIAYIPADSLTRGRHVLGVLPVPPPPTSRSVNNPDGRKATEIPFWR
jgi:hypothetical protein